MLNENLDFSTASPDVRRAFIGTPDKIQIRSGTRLFKWTEYPLFGSNGTTPWWSLVEQTRLPSGTIADGLRKSEEYAGRLGVSPRNFQRVRAAVSEKFPNSMQNLLIVELITDVWAFAGKTMGQPEFANPKMNHVFLIGGSCQLWIPGLTFAEVRQVWE